MWLSVQKLIAVTILLYKGIEATVEKTDKEVLLMADLMR